ncbi:hypothetical protein CEXT_88661 [Caerostris extrusa]|uniref:Uncharacterized protein n=1 Tax=Caerostris extrusa TaxID=172846 RepID=A0AAV4X7S4_CAEEX|nr:hypothetical protein CEXT_88661 [Caerostris extrusa]
MIKVSPLAVGLDFLVSSTACIGGRGWNSRKSYRKAGLHPFFLELVKFPFSETHASSDTLKLQFLVVNLVLLSIKLN